jgi:hypothetical protein
MQNPAQADEPLALAAIENNGSADVDLLLAAFVEQQRSAGRRVLGLLMQHRPVEAGCECDMVLTDIASGEAFKVSQSLGPGSSGCRADPQGFARASRVLREAMQAAPELVICNRFGSLEASGGGFAAELLELLSRGIPVLTVVATRHLPFWQQFTGGQAQLLPLEPAAWARWFQGLDASQAQPLA